MSGKDEDVGVGQHFWKNTYRKSEITFSDELHLGLKHDFQIPEMNTFHLIPISTYFSLLWNFNEWRDAVASRVGNQNAPKPVDMGIKRKLIKRRLWICQFQEFLEKPLKVRSQILDQARLDQKIDGISQVIREMVKTKDFL